MSKLKKYPVIYKGKEYEVRWEDFEISHTLNTLYIYKVTKVKSLFKEKIKYEFVFRYFEKFIIERLEKKGINKTDQDFYIKEVEILFELYEEEIKKKELELNKQAALAEWNGVIK